MFTKRFKWSLSQKSFPSCPTGASRRSVLQISIIYLFSRDLKPECLKPQETENMGIYICGCAAGPKSIPYSVSTALAAASKASTLLSNDTFSQELIIAEVNEDLCMGCHRCEKVCYYDAIKVGENDIAEVNELKCRGCGACVTVCPARAIDIKYYRERQFEEEIKGLAMAESIPIKETKPITEK